MMIAQHGCAGISRARGVRWAYLMPQHTATATITRFVNEELGGGSLLKHCHHQHVPEHYGEAVDVAFVRGPSHPIPSCPVMCLLSHPHPAFRPRLVAYV